MYIGYFWPREAQRERPTDICTYIHTYIGLSGLLWASLGLSGPLWASPGLSGTLWASLGLSGPLYIHTHTYIEKTRQHITDSWSPGPKLPDNKTTQ